MTLNNTRSETPVLKIWGVWGNCLFLLLACPFLPGVVEPTGIPFTSQINVLENYSDAMDMNEKKTLKKTITKCVNKNVICKFVAEKS